MAKTRLMCLGIVAALFAVPASAAQAAKLYIAPSGSDSSACSSDAPCASFNHAYQVADPGDEVEVAAGRYGNQRLDDVAGKDGSVARVWIHPASGATPQITDLLVSASNVRVTGITMPTDGSAGQPDVRAPAHDVVIENFHATNFYVTGATRDVTIKGGDYGPFLSTGGGSQIKSASDGGDGQDYPVNTVVDGVRLHDYTIPRVRGASGLPARLLPPGRDGPELALRQLRALRNPVGVQRLGCCRARCHPEQLLRQLAGRRLRDARWPR